MGKVGTNLKEVLIEALLKDNEVSIREQELEKVLRRVRSAVRSVDAYKHSSNTEELEKAIARRYEAKARRNVLEDELSRLRPMLALRKNKLKEKHRFDYDKLINKEG